MKANMKKKSFKLTVSSYSYFFVKRFLFLTAHHVDKLFSVCDQFTQTSVLSTSDILLKPQINDYNGTSVSCWKIQLTLVAFIVL